VKRGDVLSLRALNRATLARQHLLERKRMSAAAMIEHLVGMQAQAPNSPYVGLWTRLRDFKPDELAGLITKRRAVRGTLMRSTVHLVTSRDFLALRPAMQQMLNRRFRSTPFARHVAGLDMDELLQAGRAILDAKPRTRVELSTLLSERWPDRDPPSLAYAIAYLVPLVQIPPRGVWGRSSRPVLTTAEAWLGRATEASAAPDAIVLRYLKAFGPASLQDFAMWSGLSAVREVVERVRKQLRVFKDEHGRELFDVPGAPLPDEDTPAPVRFLPEYDNLMLSHADRTRVIPDARSTPLFPGNGAVLGFVLVDGFYRGNWKARSEGRGKVLEISTFARVAARDRAALNEEGLRLLEFLAGVEGARGVRFVPAT
jgi:hypothetical protein